MNPTLTSKMEKGIVTYGDRTLYHWIKPPRFLGIAVGATADHDHIRWCEDTFGSQDFRDGHHPRWYYHSGKFHFINEDDMTMFILSLE